MRSRGERITLVGAGLVGSLLAIYLARRGYEVEIFERRPDLRRGSVGGGRSINLALSRRGLNALHEVELEQDILELAIPMPGRMIHPVSGDPVFQAYGKDESEYINSVSRAGLNARLMTRAERTGRVRIHFRRRVTGVDLNRKLIQGVDEGTGEPFAHSYSRLLGTDGSASAIREALAERKEFDSGSSVLSSGYKELTLASGPAGGFQIERNALHIWPRSRFMLIALPNLDGSFTCTLFLPFEGDRESFAVLQDGARARTFFAEHFPDVEPRLTELEQQFDQNPVGQMVTVKTTPWHHGEEVLLLGDAAHAIVPFFGQGMNCGFEDCFELDRLLRAHGDDWKRVLPEFSRIRKPEADAIADMAVENFAEMQDHVGNPRFLLAKELEKYLQKRFPGEYVSRYQLVSFSTVPYSVARAVGRIQDRMLSELCDGLDQVEQVDLNRAGEWIRGELAPVLGPHLKSAERQKEGRA